MGITTYAACGARTVKTNENERRKKHEKLGLLCAFVIPVSHHAHAGNAMQLLIAHISIECHWPYEHDSQPASDGRHEPWHDTRLKQKIVVRMSSFQLVFWHSIWQRVEHSLIESCVTQPKLNLICWRTTKDFELCSTSMTNRHSITYSQMPRRRSDVIDSQFSWSSSNISITITIHISSSYT